MHKENKTSTSRLSRKNKVECGKGSGQSIETCLLRLILPQSSQSQADSSFVTTNTTLLPTTNKNFNAKSNFLKVPRPYDSQFAGPFEGPLLPAGKHVFIQDCVAFEVPSEQRLDVAHVMFRSEALRYFTDIVKPNCSTVEDAFQMLESHFLTGAHINTYTTEWNTLKFQDLESKDNSKSPAEILDALY